MKATYPAVNGQRVPLSRSSRRLSARLVRDVYLVLAILAAVTVLDFAVMVVTNTTTVFNIVVFTFFTVLWLAFLGGVFLSPASLDDLWHRVTGLPVAAQALVWLLFLPVMLGLWVWERSWPFSIRTAITGVFAAATILMLLPR